MKVMNYAKYVLIAGLFAALVISPRAVAMVAASGESASPAQTAETVRQAKVQADTEAFVADATAAVNKTVAGTKSQVNGFYLAKKVDGVAFTKLGEVPKGLFVKVSDTDKKSTAALASANAAAEEVGGVVGPCINVQYGKMENGKFVESTEGSAGSISIGVPGDFAEDGATYKLAAVYQGGAYEIFNDVSTNAKTVTALVTEAKSANVMYALIKITG